MPGRSVRPWEINEYARRVREEGLTILDIARERGVTIKAIRLWVRKGRQGANDGRYTVFSDAWEARLADGSAKRAENMRSLADRLQRGERMQDAAEAIGVSKMTAKRWAKDLGLRRAPVALPADRRPCRLYVVGAWLDGRLLFLKVGRTTRDPRKRLEAMRTGSPLRLTMLRHWWGTFADEGHLHRQLRSHRARREWFHATPEVLELLGIESGGTP